MILKRLNNLSIVGVTAIHHKFLWLLVNHHEVFLLLMLMLKLLLLSRVEIDLSDWGLLLLLHHITVSMHLVLT